MSKLAQLNGVDTVEKKFTVEASVQQKLVDHIQASSTFLERINMHVVPELSGEAIGLSITRPIASRTDTNKGERQASDPTAFG